MEQNLLIIPLPTTSGFPILPGMVKPFDYIAVTSMNMRRIREERGLKSKQLAAMINSDPSTYSKYETRGAPMGTDYMERICKALGDVRMWQFFVEPDTPIIASKAEQDDIDLFRQEVALGIAPAVQQMRRSYVDALLEQAEEKKGRRKPEPSAPKGKKKR